MKLYKITLLSFVVMVGSYFCEALSPALQFVPVKPCRVADTRNAIGPFGGPAIASGSSRDFYLPQSTCNIPRNALAYSLNVTAVPVEDLGYLTVSPSGGSLPLASTLNSFDGTVKANAAIVPAGVNGGVNVFVTDTSHVILDINGYFVASSAEEFFAVTPCRVFDSRNFDGPLGGPTLAGEQTRHIPVLSSNCGIPTNAQAYSLNFTVIPRGPLGYLATWPTGLSQPLVSTLNSENGKVTANAAIVPAGNFGSIDVYVSDAADVVVDIQGYFAPQGSASGGLSLYTLKPCRVMDTRNSTGAFAGELTVPFLAKCGLPTNPQAFVVNATVLPTRSLGYLSLWPDGENQPLASTLNSDDGEVTSNMAIVPTINGSIDAYGSDQTQLILDVFSYFAGSQPGNTPSLLVAMSGSGSGVIVTADGGVNCPVACSAAYSAGSLVTLTAVANPGSTFAGWSGGGCSGTGNCTVPVAAATSVTATFNVTTGDSSLASNAGSGVTVLPDYFGMHLQCVVSPCGNAGIVDPYPSTLGFATIRLWDTVQWSILEPTAEKFDWSRLDSLVSQATSQGVTSFVFTLGSVPAWASSNATGDCGSSPAGQCYPPNLDALDGFLTNFVRRECGQVTYYEAWNEANLGDFWHGSKAQLLNVAQHLNAIVKDPANCGCSDGVCSPGGGSNPNQILSPSVNTICSDSGSQWLTDWFALADSSGLHSDIVSFHGYECQPENIRQQVAWLRSLADEHGLTDAQIWDTEASWGQENGATEEAEASWLMRSYVVQAASGVSRFYWYAYGSCSWGSLYGPACGGSPDQQQGMRRAGTAYATVSQWLRGATIESCTSDNQQTWACTLTRPNGYEGIIMWNANSSIQFPVAGQNLVQYRDWQNTVIPVGTTVNLSPMPILLENQGA